MRLGALEAGGTKMVCAVGDENGKIYEQISIPTKNPEETMGCMIAWFRERKIEALGIGCFGPVDLKKNSPTYGYILSTPKLAWRNYDITGVMARSLGVPVGIDTDVNGSLLGEATWGQARGLTDAVYLTVGTGIGAGIMTNGKLLHGMLHPEAGHIPLAVRKDDFYSGICPYHGNCLEGLASGPSIEKRWGKNAKELSNCPEVWDLESWYLAQALAIYILILSPQRIILGGGVMKQEQLFPLIRQKVTEFLGGYLKTEQLSDMENYIVPAGLHGDQGILGCVKLAMECCLAEKNL